MQHAPSRRAGCDTATKRAIRTPARESANLVTAPRQDGSSQERKHPGEQKKKPASDRRRTSSPLRICAESRLLHVKQPFFLPFCAFFDKKHSEAPNPLMASTKQESRRSKRATTFHVKRSSFLAVGCQGTRRHVSENCANWRAEGGGKASKGLTRLKATPIAFVIAAAG